MEPPSVAKLPNSRLWPQVCMSEPATELVIRGRVISGLGEGRFLTGLDWVREQLLTKFGFEPVAGTFNIEVRSEDLRQVEALGHYRGVKILPPSSAFTIAKCFPVKIGKVDGILARPLLDDYPPNLLEVIAKVSVRETLNLKDGDPVEVHVVIAAAQGPGNSCRHD